MIAQTMAVVALAFISGDPLPVPPWTVEDAAGYDYCAAAVPAEVVTAADHALANGSGASESGQAAAILIRAGSDITAAAADPAACRRVFSQGDAAFTRALERNMRNVRRGADYRRSPDRRIAEVQAQIAARWTADQAGRLAYVELQTADRTGSAFWAWRRATAYAVAGDAGATDMMRGLLTEFDWIDSLRFGTKTAGQAWILVQHADDHPDFQQLALERMEPYLAGGGVARRDYAYLWDRVAVNTGRAQRYGTQPADTCNPDGTLAFKPMEDSETVDVRRAEMGLGPALVDLERMAAERCGGRRSSGGK